MFKALLHTLWLLWLDVFLFIWQLPQNLIGILWLNVHLVLFYGISHIKTINDTIHVYKLPTNCGSVSLGKYIIVGEYADETTIQHEYGHCKQSQYLGWLYLLVIGISSFVWCGIYKWTNKTYYWFYTEKWADKLGNVKR